MRPFNIWAALAFYIILVVYFTGCAEIPSKEVQCESHKNNGCDNFNPLRGFGHNLGGEDHFNAHLTILERATYLRIQFINKLDRQFASLPK